MIVPEKMSLSDFVTRRLNPVKVTIHLLRQELAMHTTNDTTEIDRHLLSSAVSTLELFVEDYQKLIGSTSKSSSAAAGDRKHVESSKPSLLGTA